MPWLNNTSAKTVLSIGGEDFSSEFVQASLTDGTVLNTGVVSTTGTIVLQELPGQSRIQDYARKKFPRGTEVLIDVEIDGTTRRHPRGSLLVIDSAYDPEGRRTTLDVGCLLALHQFTNDLGALASYTDLDLPDDAVFSDLQAAVQAEGKFLWVDSAGVIQKRGFFDGDGLGSNKAAATWVAVRDHTCLASAPLGGGIATPDKILVGYTWQEAVTGSPENVGPDGNRYDEDLTESTYWLEHPANIKKTQRICSDDASGKRTCRDVVLNDARKTFAVTKETSSRRNYGGPGGSVSTEVEVTRGPAVELNGSYYAERYAWELARAGGVGATVPLRGLDWVIQQRRERTYEYGTGGEVLRTIESTYRNYLSAMVQNDWRSTNGAELETSYDPTTPPTSTSRGFLTEIPTDKLYLSSRVTTKWTYLDDRTIEETETVQSSAQCNGVGIYPATGARVLQDIDATNNGVVTTQRRTSLGGLINPDQPPRDPGGDSTVTKAETFELETSDLQSPPGGLVTLTTQVPFSSALDTEAQARERAATFATTTRKLIFGDASGIRVAETMREEVFSYFPGMPFSYYDRTEGVLVKLRMNATAWGLNQGEAIFSTDGCFVGLSNGQVSLPDNTTGAAQPPQVTGESAVDSGDGGPVVVEFFDISIPVSVAFRTGNSDDGYGVITDWAIPLEFPLHLNVGIEVSGEKLSKEAQLLETDGIGSIPSFGDSILASGEGVLIPDLFDPKASREPDKIFFVTSSAKAPDQTFKVVTFAAPPDQQFEVTTFAKPADQVFEVRSIETMAVAVAEPPFIVTTFAKPADQTFGVTASAKPADQVFTVTRGATLPNQTFSAIVATAFDVSTSWAPPDRSFFVSTGPAPAPTPDKIFGVSIGGPGAPPVPSPNQTFSVTTSWAVPHKIFRAKVISRFEVDAFERPFLVTVGASTPDQVFSVTAAAKPPAQTFDVTTFAKPADQVFEVKSIKEMAVRLYEPSVTYTVTGGVDSFSFSGGPYAQAANPDITIKQGQNLDLILSSLAAPLWIKDTLDDQDGVDGATSWGVVSRNGATNSLIRASFLEPGTYYYTPGGYIGPPFHGTITVERYDPEQPDQDFGVRVGPDLPDQTFDVTVFATTPDQVFGVTTSAEPANRVFDVTTSAPAADQVFDVTVI